MRVLVIGGTGLLGSAITLAFARRGCQVTAISQCGSDQYEKVESVESLKVDRNVLGKFLNDFPPGWFDIVVDAAPHRGAQSALDLADAILNRVGRIVGLSSCSVYSPAMDCKLISETSPTLGDGSIAAATAPSSTRHLAYEQALQERLKFSPVKVTILRLGVVVGPHDRTGRLHYWLSRFLRPRKVLVPMRPAQPLQLIDARDVGRFIAHCLYSNAPEGILNVAGMAKIGSEQYLRSAADLINSLLSFGDCKAEPYWVDEDRVLKEGVAPWSQIPLWCHSESPLLPLMRIDSSLAIRFGLVGRPLHKTFSDIVRSEAISGSERSAWLSEMTEQTMLTSFQVAAES